MQFFVFEYSKYGYLLNSTLYKFMCLNLTQLQYVVFLLYIICSINSLENEMDGDALSTLIGITPGPDCLKDLVPKVGVRLKVYQCIKAIYNKELSIVRLSFESLCRWSCVFVIGFIVDARHFICYWI